MEQMFSIEMKSKKYAESISVSYNPSNKAYFEGCVLARSKKTIIPLQKSFLLVFLGAVSLFSLFCVSNIIWMQSNTLVDGVITSPEIFIQRDTSTVVISSQEITHSLEQYIKDFDFGLYFDIPSSYWKASFLNKLQFRFVSDSNKETLLMLYVDQEFHSLDGYSYDIIDHIHLSHRHSEPPEATYIRKSGTPLTPDFSDSIQVITSSTGRTENTLEYEPDYEDYHLILYSVDGSNLATRLSLGVKMPLFSLLRNMLLFVGAISGLAALYIYGGRFVEVE
jgi:hypothetical protein